MTQMILQAFSGLGMLLFGMFYMELALKEAAGIRFKSWVKNSTSTIPKSLLTGMTATAVLQSSAVVALMTLSFVSASLMSLQSGIAVIFGSNIGTTVTAWLVATLGFKVNIEAFALPMIGLGGILIMFASSNRKLSATAKVLIGFGLLFLGLDIMKNAIESFAATIDLSVFAAYPLWMFVLIGFVLTALIQSSSASTAIILSALFSQILTFDQAAAMVIGANIGSTVTALLGSIGGVPDKKRAAVAHFLFNIITAAVAFALLPLFNFVLMRYMGLSEDPITALALFHTMFNLLGVVMLTPLIPWFSRKLEGMFVYAKAVPTRYIHLVDSRVPEAALVSLRDETSNLFVKTMKYALLLVNIRPGELFGKNKELDELIVSNQNIIEFDYKKAYEGIKEIESSVVGFATKLNMQPLTHEQSEHLDQLVSSVRSCVYAAKILKDIKNNIDEFSQSDNIGVQKLYTSIRKNLAYVIMVYDRYIQEVWTVGKSDEKLLQAAKENMEIIKKATESIAMYHVSEKLVVSLLNTNRSIYVASESLHDASKAIKLHFAIDGDESV